MWRVRRAGSSRSRVLAALLWVAVVAAGCGVSSPPSQDATGRSTSGSSAASTPSGSPTAASSGSDPVSPSASVTGAPGGAGGRKVLLIVEENEEYGRIIGSPAAPRINDLADRFGLATNFQAGYPPACPSLPAYLILTSGHRHGICDDRNPSAHPISGDDLYQQVAAAGRQYRQYSESMPEPCSPVNSLDGRYLVRHAPVPYYTSEVQRCPEWDVAAGTPSSGALHDAVASGTLPAFAFVTPDACNDMHGAPVCGLSGDELIRAGDAWLGTWIDQILAGPDYTSGRLTILVTWDEGSRTSNHLPTLVISPTTTAVASAGLFTHCSTLRTIEDLLGLPPLGCAATADSLVEPFHLA